MRSTGKNTWFVEDLGLGVKVKRKQVTHISKLLADTWKVWKKEIFAKDKEEMERDSNSNQKFNSYRSKY